MKFLALVVSFTLIMLFYWAGIWLVVTLSNWIEALRWRARLRRSRD
ncbi:MAG: hypothetical protein H6651_02785 [Ardenticatenales bacterium]|nr:hypothetical protein [Ardenticatenales bacterium]